MSGNLRPVAGLVSAAARELLFVPRLRRVKLVELEISRQAWDAIPCGCGCGRSAGHVGELLQRAALGEDMHLVRATDNHVWSSPVLYSPAPAAVQVALAALADDLPQQT